MEPDLHLLRREDFSKRAIKGHFAAEDGIVRSIADRSTQLALGDFGGRAPSDEVPDPADRELSWSRDRSRAVRERLPRMWVDHDVVVGLDSSEPLQIVGDRDVVAPAPEWTHGKDEEPVVHGWSGIRGA